MRNLERGLVQSHSANQLEQLSVPIVEVRRAVKKTPVRERGVKAGMDIQSQPDRDRKYLPSRN